MRRMETNLRSLVALVLLLAPFLAGKFVLLLYYIPRMFVPSLSVFAVVVVVVVLRFLFIHDLSFQC